MVCTNKKAKYDYFIEEQFEAGIVLKGSEVKSLRAGKASIKEAYGTVEGGEAWLYQMYIAPYEAASHFSLPPRRRRKLLLRKSEIRKLIGKIKEKGYSLIPLRVYFKGPYAKVEIALAKGKKKYDKRREIAEKEAKKRIERTIRRRQKGNTG